MIRFIDLGDQILEGERRFAFFNTVSDCFIKLGYNETWSSWEDFYNDYASIENKDYINPERFKNLCDDWVFIGVP